MIPSQDNVANLELLVPYNANLELLVSYNAELVHELIMLLISGKNQ